MLKNLLLLGEKPLETVYIILSYYLSMGLVLCFAMFLIVDGFIDPFGSLMIWAGLMILFIVPVLLRVFFDFALITSRRSHSYYQWKSRKKENKKRTELHAD